MAIPKKRKKKSKTSVRRIPAPMTRDAKFGELYKTIRESKDEVEAQGHLLAGISWARDLGDTDARLAMEIHINDVFDHAQGMVSKSFQDGKMEEALYTWLSTQFLPMMRNPLVEFARPNPKTEAVKEMLENAQKEIANASNDSDTDNDTSVEESGAASAGIDADAENGESV